MSGKVDFYDFVDEYPSLGEDYQNTKAELQQKLQHLAQATNSRDIANYTVVTPGRNNVLNDDDGSPTGQNFFDLTAIASTDQQSTFYRPTYRKLVRFTGLVLGLNSVAHRLHPSGTPIGTPITNTFIFTRIYGVIQDVAAGPLWVPVPNDNVHLEVNALNVDLTIPAAYIGYNGIVILEYIKP